MTTRKGISIEFADFRDYSEGDDLRHLDWNVLARLGVPVTKTYRDEEDLAVHLLIDSSDSMRFGEPSKLSAAAKWGAALGFVALNGGDAVYARALGVREAAMPALRGRSAFYRLSTWTERFSLGGDSPPGATLAASLMAFARSTARPGLVVIASDGLDPNATAGIKAVAARGHEIYFLQILADIELDPDLEGDLKLIDSESGGPVEITANGYVLKEYRKRLAEHNSSIRDALLRVGGRYALVTTSDTVERVVRDTFKRERWVI